MQLGSKLSLHFPPPCTPCFMHMQCKQPTSTKQLLTAYLSSHLVHACCAMTVSVHVQWHCALQLNIWPQKHRHELRQSHVWYEAARLQIPGKDAGDVRSPCQLSFAWQSARGRQDTHDCQRTSGQPLCHEPGSQSQQGPGLHHNGLGPLS